MNKYTIIADNISDTGQVSKGKNIFYRCTKCNEVIPSQPNKNISCKCGNVIIDADYFRLVVRDNTKIQVIRAKHIENIKALPDYALNTVKDISDDVLSEVSGHYKEIADLMSKTKRSVLASIRYHVLADALYWTDELPEHLEYEAKNSLRFVLRYRTSMIIGTPQAELQKFWLKAKESFTNWIGFRQERCEENNKLKSIYEKLKKKSEESRK